jgi:pimeloyl-ACP methyl ester carboxylesterase
LNKKDEKFWDFDWEEMGTFDAPAEIDFILNKTGNEKLTWVGHSEGTSQLLAGAALMPDYFKSKLNLAVLLAPPAAMENCPNKMLNFLSDPIPRDLVIAAINKTHMWNIGPHNRFTTTAGVEFCKVLDGKFCTAAIGAFSDTDSTVDNTSRYDVYMSNEPAGAGWRNLVHYAQNIHLKAEAFRRYDFGDIKNKIVYGKISPPEYDLGLLDFPVAIQNGSLDKLANPVDVAWTESQIKSLVFSHEYRLGHLSFAIAKDMSFFTVDTMALINHYNGVCDAATSGSNFTEGNLKCA